jgi:hypothetical protein
MAIVEEGDLVNRLTAALHSLAPSAPVSAALTMLYRADAEDTAEIRRGPVTLRKVLVPPLAS